MITVSKFAGQIPLGPCAGRQNRLVLRSFSKKGAFTTATTHKMDPILSTILEIVKITVPSLVVFFTAYYLLKTYLDKQYQLKALELKQSQLQATVPLRLQSYERLSLFCERIAVPNLLLRLKEEEQTSAGLRVSMLITIQQEFEYNITQQVYVSDQLWQIIKFYRDDTVNVINAMAERIDPRSSSKELQQALFSFVGNQQTTILDKTLSAIKKEASMLI